MPFIQAYFEYITWTGQTAVDFVQWIQSEKQDHLSFEIISIFEEQSFPDSFPRFLPIFEILIFTMLTERSNDDNMGKIELIKP